MGWSGSSQASQSGQSSGLSHQGNGYHVYAQCLNSILLQHLSWMSAICNLACPRRLAVLGPPLIGRASFTRGPAIRQLGESRSLHQLDARCPRHLLHRARLAVAVQTLSNSLHRALSLAPQLVCCLYNPRPPLLDTLARASTPTPLLIRPARNPRPALRTTNPRRVRLPCVSRTCPSPASRCLSPRAFHRGAAVAPAPRPQPWPPRPSSCRHPAASSPCPLLAHTPTRPTRPPTLQTSSQIGAAPSLLCAMPCTANANGRLKILEHFGPPPAAAESLPGHGRPLARRQQWHQSHRPHRRTCQHLHCATSRG